MINEKDVSSPIEKTSVIAKTINNTEEASAKESVLEKIKSVKAELALYGIRDIGLFGSYARGEQTDVSDIDILIDFEPHKENSEKRAVVRSLEIIGEATKKIPADVKVRWHAVQ